MYLDATPSRIQSPDLVFESIPAPMFILDREACAFLEVNRAAVIHYGYSREEFLAKTIFDIQPVEDIPQLLDRIRSGEIRDGLQVWRHLKSDGNAIHVSLIWQEITFGSTPAVLIIMRDVSDQIRLEEQFRQAQKMEAIGRLAGGVAHDFNNLLTVISGNAAMLAEDIQDPAILVKVTDIQKAAARASSLTRHLLRFSRGSSSPRRSANPNVIVKSVCELIGRLIGEDIQVRTFLAPDVCAIRVEPVELEQVLMNLAVNARDAMPSGGTLTIHTETVRITGEEAAEAAPGCYVLLSVSDTGCGMTEEVRQQLFEPFFTTKPQGQGTGLGLSTVHAIVKQCGGAISVESAEGRGATFRIYWPVAEHPLDDSTPAEPRPKAGSETILVVEDETVVREITSEGLKRRGYNVLCASNEHAAEVSSVCRTPIHLLLTDVVMPRISGPQLARSLKENQPQMRVLFMSGYAEEALTDCSVPGEPLNLIHKPFTFDELHRKVREVLDAKQ